MPNEPTDDDMTSTEVFRAMKAIDKKNRQRRAKESSAVRDEAEAFAADHGLRLKQCAETHWQLQALDHAWLINLYPSTQRIYSDPNRPRAPYLKLPSPWTLLDAVKAAAEIIQPTK